MYEGEPTWNFEQNPLFNPWEETFLNSFNHNQV